MQKSQRRKILTGSNMAGSRIKGITIEIDGNTTKLQQSLSGVNKDLKNTQDALKDVGKLLKLDPSNVTLLEQKQKNLTKAIESTKDKLNQLKDAQSQVAKGSDEWDALQREIVATEQDLKSLKKEQSDFGSVSAQVLKDVGNKVSEVGNKISDLGKKFSGVSGAAAGFVGALGKLGYDAVTSADDLNTLSKQTGISTDTLQKMKYASDLVDVSLEDITGALKKMKPKMEDGNKTFEKLGVSVRDANGDLRGAEDVFYDAIKAMSQIENETERDQVAMELFGKSADQLAGIIDDGGASLQEYGKQAEEMGLILDGDTLDALNQTNDTIDQVKATTAATLAQVGADVATVLAPAVEKLAGFIGDITAKLRELTPEQTQVILTIASIIAVVAPVIILIGNIVTGIGGLITAIGTVAGVLGVAASTVGIVIAAIAGIIAIIVLCITHWDQIKAKVKEVWESISTYMANLKESVSEKWNEIKQNVSEKIQSIKTDLQEKWSQIKSDATQKIEDTKNDILQKFVDIKDGIKKKIEDIKGFFSGLKLKFPEIEMPKLPHFSLSGEFSLNPPSVPHLDIDWYAKGMNTPYLFTQPTLFGAGEAGAEVMYGRDNLMRDIAQATSANNEALIGGMYAAFSAALQQADLTVEINEREFGRILREARA